MHAIWYSYYSRYQGLLPCLFHPACFTNLQARPEHAKSSLVLSAFPLFLSDTKQGKNGATSVLKCLPHVLLVLDSSAG